MNIAQTIYLHISILEEVREYDRKTQSGKRILPALCLFWIWEQSKCSMHSYLIYKISPDYPS